MRRQRVKSRVFRAQWVCPDCGWKGEVLVSKGWGPVPDMLTCPGCKYHYAPIGGKWLRWFDYGG